MRKRVTWLVAAVTAAALVAFLVPLAFLLRTLAEDRAVAAASARSETLLAVASAAFAGQGTGGTRNRPVSRRRPNG